jgi:hypothetical protein
MKTNFLTLPFMALAVAVSSAVCFQSAAADAAAATSTAESGLPPEIQPGTPSAEVLKLVQAGVDENVIRSYISNCPTAFNVNADKIIVLSDAGLPGDLVNAMIAHDKNYLDSLASAQPDTTAQTEQQQQSGAPVASSEPAPVPEPPTSVTINYFNDTLAPYGSWVEVDGYGRCWRPNVILYDANWRPYCDRGQWVYTDCGWYWSSDYAWGATFHYGRWFNSPRYGWCWWPDTVWAPSWVTWRSSNEYCGWAPLPPLTVYQPGIGFYYRGKNVAIGFDFGLASSCYTFVSAGHFCDARPRYYCVPQHEVNTFYSQTTIINNFNCNNNRMINNGVSVTVIGQATRHPIQPVPIGTLVNPGRRSWHGSPTPHHFGADAADNSRGRSYADNGDRHGVNSNANPGASSQRHDLGRNQLEPNHDRSFGNVSPQPAANSNHGDRHQTVFTSRGPANATPAPITVPATKSPPAINPPQQGQQHNNWMARGEPNRPSAPAPRTQTAASKPAAPTNWSRNIENKPATRPNFQQNTTSRPVVITQSSRPSTPQPTFNRPAPRSFSSPAMPSNPASSQNQVQRGGGNSHGWLAKDR